MIGFAKILGAKGLCAALIPMLTMIEHATEAMADSEAGRLPVAAEEQLASDLRRIATALLSQRVLTVSSDTVAFLKRMIRHVIAMILATVSGHEGARTPPTMPALTDAIRLLELVLEPSRELYLHGTSYTAADPVLSHAADESTSMPPLFKDILNDFAAAGGFTAVARSVGTPGALGLQAIALLLSSMCTVREMLVPAFAVKACGALAAAACATLGAEGDIGPFAEGDVDRQLISRLFGSLAALDAAGGEGGEPACGEPGGDPNDETYGESRTACRVDAAALRVAARLARDGRLGVRLLALSIVSEILHTGPHGVHTGARGMASRRAGVASGRHALGSDAAAGWEWVPSGALSEQGAAEYLASVG